VSRSRVNPDFFRIQVRIITARITLLVTIVVIVVIITTIIISSSIIVSFEEGKSMNRRAGNISTIYAILVEI
jgi:hypothetical protein